MSFTKKTAALSAPGTSEELSLAEAQYGRTSVIVVATGDATYTVQHSFGDGVWIDHEYIADATGNEDGNYAFPIAAVRLVVSAQTTGETTLRIIGV